MPPIEMRVPLGVIGIIYESRPNVTIDAASLCLKSGNATILRGGSEAIHSNLALAACIEAGLEKSGLPGAAVQIVTPDRTVAAEMGGVNFSIYLERFYKKGVAMTPNYRLAAVTPMGNRLQVTFTNEFGGPNIQRVVDHVVVEHGTLPADALFHSMSATSANNGQLDLDAYVAGDPQPAHDGDGYQVFRIGDAVASRNVHAAIYDALRLCARL